MTAPSYETITEISLYACGFLHPRLCAGKMVRCLSLASTQLSNQDHYDFSMRTIKAVLVAAGELKRKQPRSSEVGLTYRAIIDCNVPNAV